MRELTAVEHSFVSGGMDTSNMPASYNVDDQRVGGYSPSYDMQSTALYNMGLDIRNGNVGGFFYDFTMFVGGGELSWSCWY